MPPTTPNTGGRPADLKQWDLPCNPAWKTDSGGRHHIFLFDGTWNDDTGINPALSEFAGRIDRASGDVAGNRGVSDEGGHGTAVSAVAAAARNGSNTMGVAFDATIVSQRADEPGSCASKDGCAFYDGAIAAGIDAARQAGARVINLSLGGSTPGSTLLSAMNRAVSAGVVLVISAGNDGETSQGSIRIRSH